MRPDHALSNAEYLIILDKEHLIDAIPKTELSCRKYVKKFSHAVKDVSNMWDTQNEGKLVENGYSVFFMRVRENTATL
jgi:hypothetical protein